MKTTAALLVLVISCMSVAAASPRPDPADGPKFARWLVSEGAWGVLTVVDAGGNPFSNVMSYADAGSGVPYFYLTTTLDPTGAFAVNQSTSCFTLSEAELGSCGGASQPDPQSPLCGKLTLSGDLKILPKNSKEAKIGEAALFAAHPQFQGFPKKMGFRVFKLEINRIFLVSIPKPFKLVPVDEYLGEN